MVKGALLGSSAAISEFATCVVNSETIVDRNPVDPLSAALDFAIRAEHVPQLAVQLAVFESARAEGVSGLGVINQPHFRPLIRGESPAENQPAMIIINFSSFTNWFIVSKKAVKTDLCAFVGVLNTIALSLAIPHVTIIENVAISIITTRHP